MIKIYYDCHSKYEDKFYLIATTGKNNVIKHEIAHGFFYLLPEYKKEMENAFSYLDSNVINQINSKLKEMGYTKQVFVDETQAYLSTGFDGIFDANLIGNSYKEFKEIFNKFHKKD